jgi:GntR family transcriptional regulator
MEGMPSRQHGEAPDSAAGAPVIARPLSRKDGPLYRQLVTILRRSIEERRLDAGVELPREAELARDFGVSLITVRQALRELEAQGLILKRAAKRALVTGRVPGLHRTVAFQSFAEIAASTGDRRLEILSYRREPSRQAAEALGLDAETEMPCLRAILQSDEGPVGETTIFFPPPIGDRLSRSDFDDVVVFRSVQRHLGILLSDAAITVRAETAGRILAKKLECETGDPVLTVEMLYRTTEGEPVEFTVNKSRADRFSLSYAAQNDLEV